MQLFFCCGLRPRPGMVFGCERAYSAGLWSRRRQAAALHDAKRSSMVFEGFLRRAKTPANQRVGGAFCVLEVFGGFRIFLLRTSSATRKGFRLRKSVISGSLVKAASSRRTPRRKALIYGFRGISLAGEDAREPAGRRGFFCERVFLYRQCGRGLPRAGSPVCVRETSVLFACRRMRNSVRRWRTPLPPSIFTFAPLTPTGLHPGCA